MRTIRRTHQISKGCVDRFRFRWATAEPEIGEVSSHTSMTELSTHRHILVSIRQTRRVHALEWRQIPRVQLSQLLHTSVYQCSDTEVL